MDAEAEPKRQLWIVDHQDHWRTFSMQALGCAGFLIQSYKEYSDLLCAPYSSGPDLVLLGCINSCAEEKLFLEALAQRGWPVVVLVSSLSLADLRDFFHAGAVDVVERPRTPAQLLSVVGVERSRRLICPGGFYDATRSYFDS